jgi:selT/selW/selH-like putative selenoprotein
MSTKSPCVISIYLTVSTQYIPPSLPHSTTTNTMSETTENAPIHLPRVAITFCTQCRWMLRAAYFAQELLSTFGGSLGEVALIPATGGLFTVHLTYKPVGENEGSDVQTREVLLWDRKAEGGFPETKILKQRVRNHIEPGKDLGHSDKPANNVKSNEEGVEESGGMAKEEAAAKTEDASADCADCK